MKIFVSLLMAFSITSGLFAQPVTKTYTETFDGNKSIYGWRDKVNYVIKDEAYQITTEKAGVGYQRMAFPYDFKYAEGDDWTLAVSMKKIAGGSTAQWGIEIVEYDKISKISIWMDKSGAYGDYGHMEFKVKKDFNDMKLVKIADTLKVYFNGKLMGSGSIKNVPSGHFIFSQSESSDPVIIQYDNIKFEVTQKPVAPAAVVTDTEDEDYDDDEAVTSKGFTDCNSYNIITEPGHTDCLKKLESAGFTYLYHPLWKQSQNKTGTTTFFEITTEVTTKVGDTYRQTPAEFNKSLPLFDTYHYVHFRHSVSRSAEMSFEAKLAEIKGWGHNPQEFDFTNTAGNKGKIITVNYLHDGTGIWRYEMYALIKTKDGFLYSMMDFGCFPEGEIASGVRPADESAFRQWASAYFSNLQAK